MAPHGRQPMKPELLAPAGTIEAFDAALEAGADAVYVGVGAMNARAFAKNFTLQDVAGMTRAAHGQGRKLFVALNSLMKEDEISATVEVMACLNEIGVDAVIIQDLGIWRIASTHFPMLNLHASTLMTIHNSAGVLQAERMGFKRVVLAREMTLREIRDVARATSVELEVFVHGAMCFTYSGLCMFSSFHGGKSSMRGRCVQPCRRHYEWAGRRGTFFSMDDLNGIGFVQALGHMGISSLKIEGRLKPPHYVSSVTRAYRMILDLPDDVPQSVRDATMEEARQLIAQSLGRPGSTGYFLSSSPLGAVSPTRAANTGQYLGKVVRVQEHGLIVAGKVIPQDGDRLRLVDTIYDRQQAFTCRYVVPSERQGHFSLSLPPGWEPKPGNLLFRTDMSARGAVRRREHRDKQGFSPDVLRRIKDSSRSVLSAIGALSSQGDGRRLRRQREVSLWIKVRSANQLKMVGGIKVRGIIITVSESAVRAVGAGRNPLLRGMEIVWSLPPVIHEGRLGLYRRLVTDLVTQGHRNFQVGNLGHLQILQSIRAKGRGKGRGTGRIQQRTGDRRELVLWGDYMLNVLNSQSVRAVMDMGISLPQLSVETDADNARRTLLHSACPMFFTVFAWLPLFVSRLDHSSYAHGRPVSSMRDELFYWQRGNGANVLIAQKPFSLLKRRHELEKMGFSGLIIDISNWPSARKIKKRGSKINIMDILPPGREFNFSARLY